MKPREINQKKWETRKLLELIKEIKKTKKSKGK